MIHKILGNLDRQQTRLENTPNKNNRQTEDEIMYAS